MTLIRYNAGPQGILSHLLDGQGNEVAETLTHAYERGEDLWVPIVSPGRYLCVLGKHTLNGIDWFETYQITNVAGHTGILFHQGNGNLAQARRLGEELLALVSQQNDPRALVLPVTG